MRRCQDELVGPEQYAEYVRRIERGELPLPRVSKSKDADELSDEEALGRCRELAFVFETVERMLRERNLGTFGHMILRANELLAEDAALLGAKSAPGRGSFWSMNFRTRTLRRSRCWRNWRGRSRRWSDRSARPTQT